MSWGFRQRLSDGVVQLEAESEECRGEIDEARERLKEITAQLAHSKRENAAFHRYVLE